MPVREKIRLSGWAPQEHGPRLFAYVGMEQGGVVQRKSAQSKGLGIFEEKDQTDGIMVSSPLLQTDHLRMVSRMWRSLGGERFCRSAQRLDFREPAAA